MPEQLMGLQAQAPFGVGQAIVNRRAAIGRRARARVHRLEQEMGEV